MLYILVLDVLVSFSMPVACNTQFYFPQCDQCKYVCMYGRLTFNFCSPQIWGHPHVDFDFVIYLKIVTFFSLWHLKKTLYSTSFRGNLTRLNSMLNKLNIMFLCKKKVYS